MVPDFATFTLLLLVAPVPLARAVAIGVAMSWNFFLHRHLTFPESRARSVWPQYLMFCGSSLSGAAVSWCCSVALCLSFAYFARTPLAAAVLGVGAGFLLNYTLSRAVVFIPRAAPDLLAPCPTEAVEQPLATDAPTCP